MMTLRAPSLLVLATLVSGLAAAAENDAWTSNGPPGASVFAIAPAPSDPSTIYVGTGRGVWKGQRGGELWTDASTGLPIDRVQALVVDPTNANVLYAGTVTPSGVESVGAFKSTDGGASWSAINAGLVDPFTQFSPLDVAALSIDPSNPLVVVAGTRFSEIYISLDAGATWSPRTLGGFSLGLETTGFARDPSNSERIYAVSSRGLLLSENGGVAWIFFGDARVSFFSVAVDPANPAIVYAGNVTGFGLGKSVDSGATWEEANGNLPVTPINGVGFFPAIRAVAVAPDGSAVDIATADDGLFRSTDGGTSWTALEEGLYERSFHSLAFLPGQPPTTLLAGGNGGGVYRSADAGASWTKTSASLNEALVSSVAASPVFAGTAYAAAFDGVYATGDGGRTWSRASDALPAVPVAAVAVRTLVSLQPGDTETLYAATLGTGLQVSADGGPWSRLEALEDDDISSVLLDPTNPTTLYAGTDHPYNGSNPQRVYKSVDSGASWQQTGLDAAGFSIDVLAVDPDNAARVAAVSRGLLGFFQSTDGGTSWTPVEPASECGGVNTLRYLSPGDGIVLGVTNGVCRSSDGGVTWTQHSVAPLASVEDVEVDPVDPAVLWAGASPAIAGGIGGGVYRSPDGGVTWSAFGAGLSTHSVRSLDFDASDQSLYAGILRGGVAVLPIGAPPRDLPQPPAPSDAAPRVVVRP
jgi:photosystem II stability/assembly factor-like uncharacterized protein